MQKRSVGSGKRTKAETKPTIICRKISDIHKMLDVFEHTPKRITALYNDPCEEKVTQNNAIITIAKIARMKASAVIR